MKRVKRVEICGIYKILNKISGKFYIGSSKTILERWSSHKYMLLTKTHHSKHLQQSYNKHGMDAFEFTVLEECSEDILIEREQHYLDNLLFAKEFIESNDSRFLELGYNIKPFTESNKGFRHTKESIIKAVTTRGFSKIYKVRISDNEILEEYELLKDAAIDNDLSDSTITNNMNKHTHPKDKDYYFVRSVNYSKEYKLNKRFKSNKIRKTSKVDIFVYRRSDRSLFKHFTTMKECLQYFNTTNSVIQSIFNRKSQYSINDKVPFKEYMFFREAQDNLEFPYVNTIFKVDNSTNKVIKIYNDLMDAHNDTGIARATIKNYITNKACIDNMYYCLGQDYPVNNLKHSTSTDIFITHKLEKIYLYNRSDNKLFKIFDTVYDCATYFNITNNIIRYHIDKPNKKPGNSPYLNLFKFNFYSKPLNNEDIV